MRTQKFTVEVQIGEPSEIGLALTMAGVEGTDADNGLRFMANPVVSGAGMRFSGHSDARGDVWAKVDFKGLIEGVFEELAHELAVRDRSKGGVPPTQ